MPPQSKINLEPMPGKLIIKPAASDRKVGGLFLVSNREQSIGQIVAIYDEFDDPDTTAHVEPFIQMDDWVIFNQNSGVKVTVDRETYIVLRESEILCRVINPADVDPAGVEAI